MPATGDPAAVPYLRRLDEALAALGGERFDAAILFSVVVSCKLVGVDPFAYLRDLFARISSHPQSRLAELLPDQWKTAQQSAPTA